MFDLGETCVPRALLSLKWPNDLLVDGAKASGVLIESGPSPAGLWLAVGVGVNIVSHPPGTERPATHLAAHLGSGVVAPPSFDIALSLLAAAFDRWRTTWEREGFAPIQTAWTERAHGLGRPAVARLGHETVHGLAEALEADGALRLRLPDGAVRCITAGDVFTS